MTKMTQSAYLRINTANLAIFAAIRRALPQSSSASRFTAGALDYERERAVQVTFMQHVFT